MPRDASGNYTLPVGNPVTPNTLVESAWANTTMQDIRLALSDSLSRSGLGGMLVPFRNADGTLGAPGISWANEPTSGWYRSAPQSFWYSVNGAPVFGIGVNGLALTAGLHTFGMPNIEQSDTVPSVFGQGYEWFESDTGQLYMKYQNPDASFTLISVNASAAAGIPVADKGIANGVATLAADTKHTVAEMRVIGFAQCRLIFTSTSVVTLVPFGGETLTLNGTPRTIPAAGVALTAAAVPLNATNYYVYAFWNGTDVALEVSATAYAFSVNGLAVKSSDSTRTLVGMVRKTGTGNFADDAATRFVRSFYNDPGISLKFQSSNAPTISAAPFVEIDANWRVYGLFWNGEMLEGEASIVGTTPANTPCYLVFNLDGTGVIGSAYGVTMFWAGSALSQVTTHVSAHPVSEGLHYVNLFSGTSGGIVVTTLASYCGQSLHTRRSPAT